MALNETSYHSCRRCELTIVVPAGQEWEGDNVGCDNEVDEYKAEGQQYTGAENAAVAD